MTDIRTEITWTPEAWERWAAWRDHARMVGSYFGDAERDRMMASLGNCLNQVLAAGPTRVMTDGNCLGFSTPTIYFGMVFHADTEREFRRRFPGFGDTPIDPEWPKTGTWSLHS